MNTNFRKKAKIEGPKCELLYTDTDTLLLEIETEDIYKDMGARADLFDTSDYPQDHPLHSDANKKVLGKMKDECAGTPIAECVCLWPKMYTILEHETLLGAVVQIVQNWCVGFHDLFNLDDFQRRNRICGPFCAAPPTRQVGKDSGH